MPGDVDPQMTQMSADKKMDATLKSAFDLRHLRIRFFVTPSATLLLDGQVLPARSLSGHEERRLLQPCRSRAAVDARVRGDGDVHPRPARLRGLALEGLVCRVRPSAYRRGAADQRGAR